MVWTKPGVWTLSIKPDGKLMLKVVTDGGASAMASMASPLPAASAAGFVVKATYNSTSGEAKLFVDSVLVAQGTAHPGAVLASVAPGGAQFIGSSNGHRDYFQGAVEELYIKDVSTEPQPAYIFSDDVPTPGIIHDIHTPFNLPLSLGLFIE